ncbi:sigma-70 family RNA polymerase sigma factor [Halobacillus litoralis]|uniref:sigma-70 family RNA polymerase sigma factor n=1 Tax=Halobacillus litoralis TaxID=45668 RepID=UPI001CD7EDA4|nr:sigma-70 family RNA polymerase sigma factor [Halobacillus litoralis]MCA0972508.1 sigma-70 family RNA polymerase sigma factor [Halobacillus litoralis]
MIEKHKHTVYQVIFHVIRDEKEAEDLTQETFIKMVDALPSYQGKGFKTWLSRIGFRTALDAKRKKERSPEEVVEHLHDKETIQSAEDEWLQKEKSKAVAASIERMPENYRGVVYAYYIEGKSYSTIAGEQKLQEKTIEMRLYRARKWMKEHWKEDDF